MENTTPPAPPEYLNLREAAEFLRVSVYTLRGWRARRFGPQPFKVGKQLRWMRSDLEAWMRDQRDAAAAAEAAEAAAVSATFGRGA